MADPGSATALDNGTDVKAAARAIANVEHWLNGIRGNEGSERTLALDGHQVLKAKFTPEECRDLALRMARTLAALPAYKNGMLRTEHAFAHAYPTVPDPAFMHSKFSRDMTNYLIEAVHPTVSEFIDDYNKVVKSIAESPGVSESGARTAAMFNPAPGNERVGLMRDAAPLVYVQAMFRESIARHPTTTANKQPLRRDAHYASSNGRVALAIYVNLTEETQRFHIIPGSHLVTPFDLPSGYHGSAKDRAPLEALAKKKKNEVVLGLGDVLIYNAASAVQLQAINARKATGRSSERPILVFGTELLLSPRGAPVELRVREELAALTAPILSRGTQARLYWRVGTPEKNWGNRALSDAMSALVGPEGKQGPLHASARGLWPLGVTARTFDADFAGYAQQDELLFNPSSIMRVRGLNDDGELPQTLSFADTDLVVAAAAAQYQRREITPEMLAAITADRAASISAERTAPLVPQAAVEPTEVGGQGVGPGASLPKLPDVTLKRTMDDFRPLKKRFLDRANADAAQNPRRKVRPQDSAGEDDSAPAFIGKKVVLRTFSEVEPTNRQLAEIGFAAVQKNVEPLDIFNLLVVEHGKYDTQTTVGDRELVSSWQLTGSHIFKFVYDRSLAVFGAFVGRETLKPHEWATVILHSYYEMFYGRLATKRLDIDVQSIYSIGNVERDRTGMHPFSAYDTANWKVQIGIDPLYWTTVAKLFPGAEIPADHEVVKVMVHSFSVLFSDVTAKRITPQDLEYLGTADLSKILGVKVSSQGQFLDELVRQLFGRKRGVLDEFDILLGEVLVAKLVSPPVEKMASKWLTPTRDPPVPYRYSESWPTRPDVDSIGLMMVKHDVLVLVVPVRIDAVAGDRVQVTTFKLPKDGLLPERTNPRYKKYFHGDGRIRTHQIDVPLKAISLSPSNIRDRTDFARGGREFADYFNLLIAATL